MTIIIIEVEKVKMTLYCPMKSNVQCVCVGVNFLFVLITKEVLCRRGYLNREGEGCMEELSRFS